MTWWVASIVSNVAIIAIEYLNRTRDFESFLHALPYTGVLIVIAQWALFQNWSGAPHWLMAWVVFAVGNAVMRTAVVGITGTDGIGDWSMVLIGTATMLAGSLVLKQGLS